MEAVLYWLARGLIALLQKLPLRVVARLGRLGGACAYLLDVRHRKAAIENLTRCFGHEQSPIALRALARENFRRIGETFGCAIRTAAMSAAEIGAVLEVTGADKVITAARDRRGIVAAIGHFGNFELYARANAWIEGYQFATTYRALREPSLNALLQNLRAKSGCLYFERRTEAGPLREAMNLGRLMIGFLADQHAGNRGLPVPFLGHECSTSAAPAVFALRYDCLLLTAICYRTGLGRWRIELGDPVPTHDRDTPRSVEAIMRDVNRAFETAVRRDPANWFWVHKRWKPGKHRSVRRSAGALPAETSTDEVSSLDSDLAGASTPVVRPPV
jgi:KDO2-lipid IV(A) lauroyltransferase